MRRIAAKLWFLLVASLLPAPWAAAQIGPPVPFTCTARTQPPRVVRTEGLAETVADLLLTCVGGAPPPVGSPEPLTNLRVFLNTNVTGRLLAGSLSEALLLIDDPAPPEQYPCVPAPGASTCYNYEGQAFGPGTPGTETTPGANKNVFQATHISPNSVEFTTVPVRHPGPFEMTTLRIVNLRVDANQIGLSPTKIPSEITAFVSAMGPSTLPIVSPEQVVAHPLRTASFRSSPASPTGYSQEAVFQEELPTAFQQRNTGTSAANPLNVEDQDVPGLSYNTESGFYNSGFPAANGLDLAGLADHGTRLMIRFDEIPPGLQIYTSTEPVATSSGLVARRVDTDAAGAGPFSPTTPTSPTPAPGVAPVSVVGSSAYAVYEILGSDPAELDWLRIGVLYDGVGTATMTGFLAPLSTVNTASAGDPVPRFAEAPLPARIARRGDFDDDSHVDLVWQKRSTGPVALWYMGGSGGNEAQSLGWIAPTSIPGWSVAAVGDLNNDGYMDVVWQEVSTGRLLAWYLGGDRGNEYQFMEWIFATTTPGWTVVALADIDRDGHEDLIWQEESTRRVSVWYLGGPNGNEFQKSGWLSDLGVPGWRVVAVADLDNDDHQDIILQEDSSGRVLVRYMTGSFGTIVKLTAWISVIPNPYRHVIGVADLDNDGWEDVVWQEQTAGRVMVWYLGGTLGNEYQRLGWIAPAGTPDWRAMVP